MNNKISYIQIVAIIPSGPYADWKTTHSIVNDAGDEDNDGISNFMEFALGGNPHVAGSAARPYVGENVGTMEFKFQRAQESVTYTIETSTDLIDWSAYETVDDSHGVVGGEASVPVPISEMNDGKLFLRLRIAQ